MKLKVNLDLIGYLRVVKDELLVDVVRSEYKDV